MAVADDTQAVERRPVSERHDLLTEWELHHTRWLVQEVETLISSHGSPLLQKRKPTLVGAVPCKWEVADALARFLAEQDDVVARYETMPIAELRAVMRAALNRASGRIGSDVVDDGPEKTSERPVRLLLIWQYEVGRRRRQTAELLDLLVQATDGLPIAPDGSDVLGHSEPRGMEWARDQVQPMKFARREEDWRLHDRQATRSEDDLRALIAGEHAKIERVCRPLGIDLRSPIAVW